jgi:hypothetical protein
MKIGKPVIFLWLPYFCSSVAFAIRPNPLGQLGFMVFGFCLLCGIGGALIRAFLSVLRNGLKGFITPSLLVALLFAPLLIGKGVRLLFFKWDLPRYEAAAQWVERQPLTDDSLYVNLDPPAEFASLAYAIHRQHSPACGTVILFFWGSGFPLKHTVRMYSPQDSVVKRECLGDWHSPNKLAEHWYEASD